MLGASRARAFRSVTLPLLAPSIIAAASIVFLFTFTSFGVALLLVGSRARDARGRDLPPGDRPVRPPRRRPRSRSSRSSRCSRSCSRSARAQERRAVAQRLVGGGRLGPPAARAGSASWSAAMLGATIVFLGGPLVGAGLAVARTSAGTGASARTGRSARARRRSRCSSRRGRRCATRSSSRRSPPSIALVVGGLASVAIAPRPGRATRALRRVPDAAARHVGGDGRLRLPPRVPTTCRSACDVAAARADRARGGRDPVRRARGRARAAQHRSAAARRGHDARRAARGGSGARSTCRSCAARSLVAAGFCAAVSLGEFGATLFIARPDWPTVPIAIARFLGPARADQRRPGAGDVGDPHGADRASSCSRSSASACATSGEL